MAYHYNNLKRASDPYSLPSIETFYRTQAAIAIDDWRDGNGDLMGEGWYWWACFPGCMPDGEPNGPFASEDEALVDARSYGDDDSEEC